MQQQQRQTLSTTSSSTTQAAPDVAYHSRKQQQIRHDMETTPDAAVHAPPVEQTTTTTSAQEDDTTQQQRLPHHGTGPTAQGYVIDAVGERHHAPFRDATVPDHSPTVQELFQRQHSTTKKHYVQCPPHQCSTKTTTVVAGVYNPSPTLTRYVTLSNKKNGAAPQRLEPQSLLVIVEDEQQQSGVPQVSVVVPSTTTRGGGSVVIVPYADRHTTTTTTVTTDVVPDCPTPCAVASSLLPLLLNEQRGVTDLAVNDNDWKIVYTMEDPYANGKAKIEKTAFQSQTYYATQSWKSSAVILSHYQGDLDDAAPIAPALAFDALPAKAVYLANDNCNAARRNKWQAAVDAALPVVAYGACAHNTELPTTTTTTTKDAVLSTPQGRIELYQTGGRIALILETGVAADIVTRQVWEALAAGTVPAIYGATNLHDRLPHHSAIVHANFTTWDTFAAHVAKVANDKALWEEYHAWRTDPVELARIRDLYAFTKTPPLCRLCAWAEAKEKGLEWNHGEQRIVESFTAERQLCVGAEGWVTAPFHEAYEGYTTTTSTTSTTACSKEESSSSSTVTIGRHLQRTVVSSYDGVTDFTFSSSSDNNNAAASDTVLTLTFPHVHNVHGAFFRHPHTRIPNGTRRTPWVSSITIQDDRTKVTVLSDGVLDLTSPAEGVIRIPIPTAHPDRLRVIVEHMGEQDKRTEFFPSPFGQRMMLDFVDPVEYYYAEEDSNR